MVTMLEYHHRRRIFHLIPGLLIIAISYVIPTYPLGFILLGLVTSAVHYMHIKRSNDRQFDIWYIQKYGQLLRGEELGEWILVEGEYRRKKYPIHSGAFYWLLGTTLSSIIFSLDVARTALLVLSVSDPFAAYVGVWFSNRNCNITWVGLRNVFTRNGRAVPIGPTVAGSLACGLATYLCTFAYFPKTLSTPSRLSISVATLVTEAVAGRLMRLSVDDNLMIPLVVGLLITYLEEDEGNTQIFSS